MWSTPSTFTAPCGVGEYCFLDDLRSLRAHHVRLAELCASCLHSSTSPFFTTAASDLVGEVDLTAVTGPGKAMLKT